MAMPMLYAAMGISLGTLAGTVIALDTQPPSAQTVAADVSAAANNLVAESQVSAAANPAWAPAQQSQAAQTAQPSDNASKKATQADSPAAPGISAGAAEASKTVKAGSSPVPQSVPVQAPAAEKNSQPRVTPEEIRPARPAAHPLTRPARTVLASSPADEPVQLIEQLSVSRSTVASDFFSEGDLTVADYDASTGTIESSDGRTFHVGPTVAMNNATSWDDYRSDVHYRCDQSGSCTLIRPGAIASNATLI